MASVKGTIGILTGGGDVPGLNPAIRAVTIRAQREGYRVLGIRRGWAGLVHINSEDDAPSNDHVETLTRDLVDRVGRTGGTFLRTSRTNPSRLPRASIPEHLREKYTDNVNDVTPEVLKNLDFLKIDYLIPIGGDDTLSYAQRLAAEGVGVVAIPKTMDNDVPGTDYCIGFGTCVTRTIEFTNKLRTCAASHERILVIEVFGRYAGFTALLPTMAGAADRCVLPEHPFDIHQLARLLIDDRDRNPERYAIVLVSEGARIMQDEQMTFEGREEDQYGHLKLGGVGDRVSQRLKEVSPDYNRGQRVNILDQRLSYLVRCGDPDALDVLVPMAFGNLAMDLILKGESGRLVSLRNGRYNCVPLDLVTGRKKIVDIEKYYNVDRLRPTFESFSGQPLFVMTSDQS